MKEVIDSCYLSRLSPKPLEECNEEYLESHKTSAPHIQSVVRFRHVLKPAAEETKSKGAKDLHVTLSLENTSLLEAVDGLHILNEIGASGEAREEYFQAALKRWPEASAFHNSR